MIAATEDGELARRFLRESITKHRIDPDTLTVHADRGLAAEEQVRRRAAVGPARHPVALAAQDVQRQPLQRGAVQDAEVPPGLPRPLRLHRARARQLCGEFFSWYNHDHRHSEIGLHTPASVHFGTADEIRQQRGTVLAEAYTAHPERFVRATPQPPELPDTVWINPPTDDTGKEEIDVPPSYSTK
jgi:putative transposase